MRCGLISLRGPSRACLPRPLLRNSLVLSRPIWTLLSRLIFGKLKGTETSTPACRPSNDLRSMQKQFRQGNSAPRLTLEQVGRVVGTNTKGKLSREIENVIFVAIDCEAYEFAQHKTTEIGVSVLDTASIIDISPGAKAEAWLGKIKSEHFRIKEFAHLVNKRWVKGDPDSFSFGSSTWIGRSEAGNILTEIFAPPGLVPSRNIVLVGHGLKNEVAYLQNLHFDLMNAPNIVAIVDTQSIGSTKNQLGLKKLCEAVGMEPQSLHNAGNDAAYTLRALILAAISRDSAPESFEAAFQRLRPPVKTRRVLSAGKMMKTPSDRPQTNDQPESHPQKTFTEGSEQVKCTANQPETQNLQAVKSKSHQEKKARRLERRAGAASGSATTGPVSR